MKMENILEGPSINIKVEVYEKEFETWQEGIARYRNWHAVFTACLSGTCLIALPIPRGPHFYNGMLQYTINAQMPHNN